MKKKSRRGNAGMRTITIYLEPEIHKALKIMAAQEQTSVTAVIRNLVGTWLGSKQPSMPTNTKSPKGGNEP